MPFDPHRIPARDRISRPFRRFEPKYDTFRSLCIKGGWPRAATEREIISEVERAFRKFPDTNVRFAIVAGERIAYINFVEEADAKYALEQKPRVHVFDRTLDVEPVIKGVLPVDPRDRDRRNRSSSLPRPKSPNRKFPIRRSPSRSPPPRSPPSRSPPPRSAPAPPRSAVIPNKSNNRARDYDLNGGPSREVFYDRGAFEDADDKGASRILFVGDLDRNITEKNIYTEFQRFANVMSIDMKYPRDGLAYAHVAFLNPDESAKAKKGMHKQMIGRSVCNVTYGTSPVSKCIWVGGLNRTTTLGALESSFDPFGSIKKIDYNKGDTFAYILYESVESAKASLKKLSGKHVAGSDHRARFDYVDYEQVSAMNYQQNITRRSLTPPKPEFDPRDLERDMDFKRSARPAPGTLDQARGRGSHGSDRYPDRGRDMRDAPPPPPPKDRGPARRSPDHGRFNNRRDSPIRARSVSRSPVPRARNAASPEYRRSDRGGRGRSPDQKRGRVGSRDSPAADEPRKKRDRRSPSGPSAADATDVGTLARSLQSCWKGYLVLKNSAFGANMLLLDGSVNVCRKLLVEESSGEPATALKITQRLRCDPAKLEEVRRRIEGAATEGFCILLATQREVGKDAAPTDVPEGTAPRNFKNLVSYLKTKHAAGVIGLPIGARENQGVLHAFPPSKFFQEDVNKVAPKLVDSENSDDHLIIVILSGSA